MKKILSSTLVVMLVVGISLMAFAHGGGRGGIGQGYRRDFRDDYRDELDLSLAQLDKMEELQEKYYNQVEDIVDELRYKNDDLRYLYFDNDGDRDEIVVIQNEIIKLRDQLFRLRAEYQLDLRDILSANQLDVMEDYGFMGFGHMMTGYGMMGGFRGHMYNHGMMHRNGMMGW